MDGEGRQSAMRGAGGNPPTETEWSAGGVMCPCISPTSDCLPLLPNFGFNPFNLHMTEISVTVL